jgi:hypothetical protein
MTTINTTIETVSNDTFFAALTAYKEIRNCGVPIRSINDINHKFGTYDYYEGLTWKDIYDLALNGEKIKVIHYDRITSQTSISYCEASTKDVLEKVKTNYIERVLICLHVYAIHSDMSHINCFLNKALIDKTNIII